MTKWLVIRGATIAAAGWAVGYAVTKLIFSYSASVGAYSALMGWWLAAYLSAIFELTLKSCAILAFSSFCLFFFSYLSGNDWFYTEALSLPLVWGFLISVIQAMLIISPVLFDYLCRKIKKSFTRL